MLQSSRRFFTCLICCGLPVVVGCGRSSPFPLASVAGTVTFDGKPVTGGSIRFIPSSKDGIEAGKVAIGIIQSDGTFRLTSYKEGDGATVGSGTISYTEPPSTVEPPPDATPETWKPPATPYARLTPSSPDVTIVNGSNELTVELIRRKENRRR